MATDSNPSAGFVFALLGNAPGAVGGFMPLVGDATRAIAQQLVEFYTSIGRTVRIVECPECRAAEWHTARAAERGC